MDTREGHSGNTLPHYVLVTCYGAFKLQLSLYDKPFTKSVSFVFLLPLR